jgi:hypothetical protein
MDLESMSNNTNIDNPICVAILAFAIGRIVLSGMREYSRDLEQYDYNSETALHKENSFYECSREGDTAQVSISNLQFSQILDSRMNWYDAMKFSDQLGNGWRLPTRQELAMAKKIGIINNKKYIYYWTCNESSEHKKFAWCVNDHMVGGCYSYHTSHKTNLQHVLLVRKNNSCLEFEEETPPINLFPKKEKIVISLPRNENIKSFPRKEKSIISFPRNEQKITTKLISMVEKVISKI